MARNKFGGNCYRCKKYVPAGAGHFERLGRTWRVQHAECAIKHRGEPDPAREAYQHGRDVIRAATTGKSAQNARRRLRAKARGDI